MILINNHKHIIFRIVLVSPFDTFKGCSLVFNNLKVFTFNNFRVIINSKRGCFVHAIYFYKDKQGNQPVLDYMRELARHDSKDSRIKLNKLNDYIELLSQHGTRAGQPYIKHLDAEIWELRPLRDRILFVAWLDGSFVLLHPFVKKTQKIPRREIEKAKRELQDLKERGLRDEE